MSHNIIISCFYLPDFHISNSAFFFHSILVFSIHIDIIFMLFAITWLQSLFPAFHRFIPALTDSSLPHRGATQHTQDSMPTTHTHPWWILWSTDRSFKQWLKCSPDPMDQLNQPMDQGSVSLHLASSPNEFSWYLIFTGEKNKSSSVWHDLC